MKKSIISVTISVVSLASCSNPVEDLTNQAITEVQSQLLDPKSFELIETKVDTLHQSWRDHRENNRNDRYFNMWSDLNKELSKKFEWEIAFGTSSSASIYLKQIENSVDSMKFYSDKFTQENDRIEKMTGTPQDSVIGYEVFVRYYANSRGGNRVIGEQNYYTFTDGTTRLEKVEN